MIFIYPVLTLGIIGFSYLRDLIHGGVYSTTWFCKENNMYITIEYDVYSENGMIILNKTDTIFTSNNLGATLYCVQLHFKANNDTVLISSDCLAISKIKSRKYTIVPIKTYQKNGQTNPIINSYNDIVVCGEMDFWGLDAFKDDKNIDLLKVDN